MIWHICFQQLEGAQGWGRIVPFYVRLGLLGWHVSCPHTCICLFVVFCLFVFFVLCLCCVVFVLCLCLCLCCVVLCCVGVVLCCVVFVFVFVLCCVVLCCVVCCVVAVCCVFWGWREERIFQNCSLEINRQAKKKKKIVIQTDFNSHKLEQNSAPTPCYCFFLRYLCLSCIDMIQGCVGMCSSKRQQDTIDIRENSWEEMLYFPTKGITFKKNAPMFLKWCKEVIKVANLV